MEKKLSDKETDFSNTIDEITRLYPELLKAYKDKLAADQNIQTLNKEITEITLLNKKLDKEINKLKKDNKINEDKKVQLKREIELLTEKNNALKSG